MSEENCSPSQMEKLLANYLAGNLCDKQQEELARALEQDKALLERLVENAETANLLNAYYTQQSSCEEFCKKVQEAIKHKQKQKKDPVQEVIEQPQDNLRFSIRYAVAVAVLCAAAIFMLIIYYGVDSFVPVPAATPSTTIERPTEQTAKDGFPIISIKTLDGALAENPLPKSLAWLHRSRGLVMVKRKGNKFWRLLKLRDELESGDLVRTSAKLESSTMLLGTDKVPASERLEPTAMLIGTDGSSIFMRSGTIMRFNASRNWHLEKGFAYFKVNSGKDLNKFVVTSPDGSTTALGTKFSLSISPENRSHCKVDEGEVSIKPTEKPAVIVDKTRVASIENGRVVLVPLAKINIQPKFDISSWLYKFEEIANDDYGIGELIVKGSNDTPKHSLEIKCHHVTVNVVDQVARTFIDEVFINNTNARLEGTFFYPLPDNATISEFAMYVNGVRIQGEVLERHRARQIYEYIVRQRRDPALLEWVGGNLFKMRIFPIEPHSEKRIQLAYTQVLKRNGGTVTYTYPLFSEKLLKNPLKDLKIVFKVASQTGLQQLKSLTHKTSGNVSEDGKHGILGFHAKSYSPQQDFSVSYKVPDKPECVISGNLRPDEKDGYFMLRLRPKIDLPKRTPPKRLLVIVDGSGSMGARGYSIASEFAGATADMMTGIDYNILRGGMDPKYWNHNFTKTDYETSGKVRKFLDIYRPNGATDLLLTFKSAAESLPRDDVITQIIYVGDGVDTIGELEDTPLAKKIAGMFANKKVELNCVSVGSSYNYPFMKSLSALLGGTVIKIEGVNDIFKCADRTITNIFQPVLSNVKVDIRGANTAGIYPKTIGTVAADNSIVVLGRIRNEKNAEVFGIPCVSLHLTFTANEKKIEREYSLPFTADLESNRYMPRLWAKAFMDEISAKIGLGTPDDDKKLIKQIIDISIHYQIMSKYTAFLVLESDEDYERFGLRRRLKIWDWNTGEDQAEKENNNKGVWKHEWIRKNINRLRADLIEDLEVEKGGYILAAEPPPPPAQYTDEERPKFFDDKVPSGESYNDSSEKVDVSSDDTDDDDYMCDYSCYLALEPKLSRWFYSHWENDSASYVYELSDPANELPIVRFYSLEAYKRFMLVTGEKDALALRFNLVFAYENNKDYDKALRELDAVIKQSAQIVPANSKPYLYVHRGILYYKANDYEKMTESFMTAIEIYPKNEKAPLIKRIFNALRLNDCAVVNLKPDKTIIFFINILKILKNEEHISEIASKIIDSYDEIQKTQIAFKLWDKALEAHPELGPLHLAAAEWFENYDYKKSLKLLRRARSLGVDVGTKLLGLIVYTENKDSIVSEFLMALKLSKNNYVASREIFAIMMNKYPDIAKSEAYRIIKANASVAQMVAAFSCLDRNNISFNNIKIPLKLIEDERLYSEIIPATVFCDLFCLLCKNGHEAHGMRLLDKVLGYTKSEKMLTRVCSILQSGLGEEVKALKDEYDVIINNHASILLANPAIYLSDNHGLSAIKFDILKAKYGKEGLYDYLIRFIKNAKDEKVAYNEILEFFYYIFYYTTEIVDEKNINNLIKTFYAFEKTFQGSEYNVLLLDEFISVITESEYENQYRSFIKSIAERYPESDVYVRTHVRNLLMMRKTHQAYKYLNTIIENYVIPSKKSLYGENHVPSVLYKFGEEYAAQAELIYYLARVSILDKKLGARFLKLANEKAKTEHPVMRQWTEAILAYYAVNGNADAYINKLESLYSAQPKDPVWEPRLLEAYEAANYSKKAYEMYKQLFKRAPDDFNLLGKLYDMSVHLKSKEGIKLYGKKLHVALKRAPFQITMEYINHEVHFKYAFDVLKDLPLEHPMNQDGSAYSMLATMTSPNDIAQSIDYDLKAFASPGFTDTEKLIEKFVKASRQEKYYRLLKPRAKILFSKCKDPNKLGWLRILNYKLANLIGDDKQAVTELNAATTLKVTGVLRRIIFTTLWKSGQQEDAIKYAFAIAAKAPKAEYYKFLEDDVLGCLRNVKHYKWDVIVHKELLKFQYLSYENQCARRRALIKGLLRNGNLQAAEKESKNFSKYVHSSDIDNTCEDVINAYKDKNKILYAIGLVHKFQKLYPRIDYNSLLLKSYFAAFIAKELPQELVRKLEETLLEYARKYYNGEIDSLPLDMDDFRFYIKKLGHKDKLEVFVMQAAGSDNPNWIKLAANYYHDSADQTKVINLYEKALKLTKYKFVKIDLLDTLYVIQTDGHKPDWEKALEYLEAKHKLMEKEKAYRTEYYFENSAFCLYSLGRKKEAREKIRKLFELEGYKKNPYAYARIGYYCYKTYQDYEMAIDLYEKHLKLSKMMRHVYPDEFLEAYFECGRLHAIMGNMKKAIEYFLIGLSLCSDYEYDHYMELAEELAVLIQKGSTIEKVIKDYEKEMKKSGGMEKPHMRIVFGIALRKVGNHLESLRQFRIASELLPKNQDLWKEVIKGYEKLGKKVAVIFAYHSWAKLDPQNIEVYQMLGDYYYSNGIMDEALLTWSTMAEVRPKDAAGHRAYGKALFKIGQYENAARAFRKAILYRPTVYDISSELADCYKKMKQEALIPPLWKEGEASCRQAIKNYDKDELPWLSLGRFLEEQGKYAEAKSLYLEIVDRFWGETEKSAEARLNVISKKSDKREPVVLPKIRSSLRNKDLRH